MVGTQMEEKFKDLLEKSSLFSLPLKLPHAFKGLTGPKNEALNFVCGFEDVDDRDANLRGKYTMCYSNNGFKQL